MSNRSPPRPSGPQSALTTDLSALFEEAVAAVETHNTPRPGTVTRAPAPPSKKVPLPAPTSLIPQDEVEVVVEPPAPASKAEEEPTAEPGLDLGTLAVEWDKMVAELQQLRLEYAALKKKAESEAVERARAVQRIKRLTEQLDQMGDAVNRAEEARRHAERESAQAQEASRTASDNLARMRDRMRRTEEEARLHGHGPLILEILPVVDNLERASTVPDASPERIGQGLKMILDQFRAALNRVGVRRVDASSGQPFQPAIHEAVLHVAAPGHVAGTIIAELQPGWHLHGRLLRPARVSVAAHYEPAARHADPAEATPLQLPDDLSVVPDSDEPPQDQDLSVSILALDDDNSDEK